MPTIYIVATPIGNLEDFTLRAIRILKEVDMILCEDTRVTAKLLQKYGIKTPTISYHSHSKLSKVEKIFTLLESGKNLALVSDAGTPAISDPGALLVSQIKEKFGAPPTGGVTITPIPGPSAVIAALSASGIPAAQFVFLGFLPHKKGRETLFKEIAESKRAVVFYESPHRVMKTLASLKERLKDKRIAVGRELTKIHEEIISGSPTEVFEYFASNKEKVRGEFVVIISGR